MLKTPVITETLLQQYYGFDASGTFMSQATKDALVYLLNKGMVDRSDRAAQVTPKGEFFVKHILSIPFPVESFVIPDKE